MSELTKEDALGILNSRRIVSAPGKYRVKVNNVTAYEDKHIVNVGAMNMYQAKQAREALAEDKIQEAVNSNLSMSILAGKKLPSKGELIYVHVGNVTLKSKEVAMLIVGWNEVEANEEIVSFDFTAEAKAKDDLATSESEFAEAKSEGETF